MTENKFNPRAAVLLIFILLTALLRVIFNLNYQVLQIANFSPIGAMALFGGAYFNPKWKGFALPLFMLFVSDVFLQQTVFSAYSHGLLYEGWAWVYGAFALMVFAGQRVFTKISVSRFLVAVIACTIIHWIVTDPGVWIGSTTYPPTINGFITCLESAIPFEWRFMTGTFLYGVVLFGLFEWMKTKYPSLNLMKAKT